MKPIPVILVTLALTCSLPVIADQGLITASPKGMESATFAGGCFWCMEGPFDEISGVLSTTLGYTGGHQPNPTYEEVSAGKTGHAEAVRIVYDPQKVSYEELLRIFWHNVDPANAQGQFCDSGSQYRSAIFYHDDSQRRAAQASRDSLRTSGAFTGALATTLQPAETFYVAEEYHQDYYRKNPIRYKTYRFLCGRDRRLAELWGEPQV